MKNNETLRILEQFLDQLDQSLFKVYACVHHVRYCQLRKFGRLLRDDIQNLGIYCSALGKLAQIKLE